MAKQILNTGVSNNDKSGDTLRAGGLKIKANFDEIYAALANDGLNISGGPLLKTASYTDLRNLPEFKELAITGSFDDLINVPELAKYVETPPENSIGKSGDMTGDISSDNNYVYVCTKDYLQQPSYGPLTFRHEENFIDYSLRAATSETDTTAITLKPGSGVPAPSVDWTVTDGTVTRTITLVTEIGDGSGGVWYECTLDGIFTTVANEFYKIQFAPPAGGYVACFTWTGGYQPVVDAHVAGTLFAKLFKTGDTIGRTIAHAVYDSLSNELTIAYTGDQFTDYTGMSIVIDQPIIWKRIAIDTAVW